MINDFIDTTNAEINQGLLTENLSIEAESVVTENDSDENSTQSEALLQTESSQEVVENTEQIITSNELENIFNDSTELNLDNNNFVAFDLTLSFPDSVVNDISINLKSLTEGIDDISITKSEDNKIIISTFNLDSQTATSISTESLRSLFSNLNKLVNVIKDNDLSSNDIIVGITGESTFRTIDTKDSQISTRAYFEMNNDNIKDNLQSIKFNNPYQWNINIS